MQSISVNQAIARGVGMVYGPPFFLAMGLPLLMLALAGPLNIPYSIAGACVALGFVLAWIRWSLQVPRWRVWALEHVDDSDALHQRAVQVGIEWPYGHIFERTEIKPPQLALREATMQLRYYLQLAQYLANSSSTAQIRQEYGNALLRLRAGQPIAAPALATIEQELAQQAARATRPEAASTFAATAFFARRYRRAAQRAGV